MDTTLPPPLGGASPHTLRRFVDAGSSTPLGDGRTRIDALLPEAAGEDLWRAILQRSGELRSAEQHASKRGPQRSDDVLHVHALLSLIREWSLTEWQSITAFPMRRTPRTVSAVEAAAWFPIRARQQEARRSA